MMFDFDLLAERQLVIQVWCLLEESVVLEAERTGIVVGTGQIDTAVVVVAAAAVVAVVAVVVESH